MGEGNDQFGQVQTGRGKLPEVGREGAGRAGFRSEGNDGGQGAIWFGVNDEHGGVAQASRL